MTSPVRFPSVPQADDPELAEHALWNDEIADHLSAMHDNDEAANRWASFRDCACGLLKMRRGLKCPCGQEGEAA
jgi:hypothetical protein